jgi:hypothetical protein
MSEQTLLLKNAAILYTVNPEKDDRGGFA